MGGIGNLEDYHQAITISSVRNTDASAVQCVQSYLHDNTTLPQGYGVN